MNILFDDGSTLDRRLRFEDQDEDLNAKYLGRYDPFSEAFRFFKPVDNIWGDFRIRDKEEVSFARAKFGKNGLQLHSKDPKLRPYKNKFKAMHYLKRIVDIQQIDGKTKIDWKKIEKETVDIATLFPPDENIFKDNSVIGVAFSIYRREFFNPNREKTFAYYLDVRIVVDENFIEDHYPFTFKEKKIISILASDILIEKWNPRIDLSPPENDNASLYRVGPILVLNKNTILNNRNYTGDNWEAPPKNWAKMSIENPNGKTTFEPHQYWEFEKGKPPKPKMVVRIGREGSKYILFLHGDQEAGCPIRIPQDE